MPKKQDNLKRIIESYNSGYNRTSKSPSLSDFRYSVWANEIFQVYRRLGGVLNEFPFRFSNWDCNFRGVPVELDEQLHFNRYRLLTLESSVYSHDSLSNFPHELYVDWCKRFERECKKAGSYGGKWTNSSCEKMFGRAAPKGELSDAGAFGAPRWKQRAFYDYLKDVYSIISRSPVVRVAIWDTIRDSHGRVRTVNEVLENSNIDDQHSNKAILEVIQERAGLL